MSGKVLAMPITSSAKKALRASKRKRVFNEARKKTMRETVKAVKKATSTDNSKELLAKAYQAIDKAVKRGVLKPNAGARKKSQMSATLKNLK